MMRKWLRFHIRRPPWGVFWGLCFFVLGSEWRFFCSFRRHCRRWFLLSGVWLWDIICSVARLQRKTTKRTVFGRCMYRRGGKEKADRMNNEKEDMSNDMSSAFSSNYALSTKPERKQEVHTYIFLAPPLTLTLTDLTFAFQIALDLLWEWLTLFPKWAAFSQIAHLAMIAPP